MAGSGYVILSKSFGSESILLRVKPGEDVVLEMDLVVFVVTTSSTHLLTYDVSEKLYIPQDWCCHPELQHLLTFASLCTTVTCRAAVVSSIHTTVDGLTLLSREAVGGRSREMWSNSLRWRCGRCWGCKKCFLRDCPRLFLSLAAIWTCWLNLGQTVLWYVWLKSIQLFRHVIQ